MSDQRRIFSVSELNLNARRALETGLGEVWVSGELSRVTLHSSGHWYFTLKDSNASVSCAMFSKQNVEVNQQLIKQVTTQNQLCVKDYLIK